MAHELPPKVETLMRVDSAPATPTRMPRTGASLGQSTTTVPRSVSPGAIGACATPSRVFKGMRMAGQHGNQRVTVLNLEVVQADPERGLLLIKGSVPGPNGGVVIVRNAVKAK